MENISRPPGALKLARQLNECMLEKEALERQVEELRAQLQTAENHSACQEEKVQELTTQLERQMIQTESLQRQVDDYKQQDQEQELNASLEYNMRLQLIMELERTKEKLADQKKLKETYISKGKKTHNELERLKRLCDKETMDILNIVNETVSDIKKQQRKELERNFETLKVAHITSQKKFIAELQVEKDQNEALKQELEGLKVSYQISLRSESAKLSAERQVTDSLQNQLKGIQSEAKCLSEMLELMRQLNNEKDALLQQKDEEIQILEKIASEKEKHLLAGLEDQKEKQDAQTSAYQELVTALPTEQEVSQSLRNTGAELKEEQKDRTSEQEGQNSEEKPKKEKKKHSAWKKFKLRLGFWKK